LDITASISIGKRRSELKSRKAVRQKSTTGTRKKSKILIGQGDDWPTEYYHGFDEPMAIIERILLASESWSLPISWHKVLSGWQDAKNLLKCLRSIDSLSSAYRLFDAIEGCVSDSSAWGGEQIVEQIIANLDSVKGQIELSSEDQNRPERPNRSAAIELPRVPLRVEPFYVYLNDQVKGLYLHERVTACYDAETIGAGHPVLLRRNGVIEAFP